MSKQLCHGTGRIACLKGLRYWSIHYLVLVNWSVPSSLEVVSGKNTIFCSRNPMRQDVQMDRVPYKEVLNSTAAVDFVPSESRCTKEQVAIKSEGRKLRKRKYVECRSGSM